MASSVAVDGALQLRLPHLRPAPDALVPGLLVELLLRASAGSRVRPEAAPASGRDVADRGSAGLLGLARARPLLVHRPGGDLLGRVLVAAPLLQALLDVLVLAFALGAPGLLRHDLLLSPRAGSGRRLSMVRTPFATTLTLGFDFALTRVRWRFGHPSPQTKEEPWSTSMRRSRGRAISRADPARSRTSVAARSARSTFRGRPGPATRSR